MLLVEILALSIIVIPLLVTLIFYLKGNWLSCWIMGLTTFMVMLGLLPAIATYFPDYQEESTRIGLKIDLFESNFRNSTGCYKVPVGTGNSFRWANETCQDKFDVSFEEFKKELR